MVWPWAAAETQEHNMATGYQLTPEELRAVAENGSARDKAAAASGQFAQTFNQSIATQGRKSCPPCPP